MKVNEQLLKIQSLPYDELGNKLEPEALPAERILVIDAPVRGSIDQQIGGAIRSSINIQGTVSQFANGLRTMCAECVHFDPGAWERRKAQLEGSKEGVNQLNNMRWALIQEGLGPAEGMHVTQENEVDLEHAIAFLGVCRALTEHKRDETYVHPMSGCPDEVCTPTHPDGFFETRNYETRRAGDAAYDDVMRKAQGKLP